MTISNWHLNQIVPHLQGPQHARLESEDKRFGSAYQRPLRTSHGGRILIVQLLLVK